MNILVSESTDNLLYMKKCLSHRPFMLEKLSHFIFRSDYLPNPEYKNGIASNVYLRLTIGRKKPNF